VQCAGRCVGVVCVSRTENGVHIRGGAVVREENAVVFMRDMAQQTRECRIWQQGRRGARAVNDGGRCGVGMASAHAGGAREGR